MVSTIQTLPQIKSQEFINHIKQHFMTSPLRYVNKVIQDFIKCCIKSWLHVDLQPDNILFGGARSSSVVTLFAHGVMGRRIDPSLWTH